MAVETGIPPDYIAEMDTVWIDAMNDVLIAKVKAANGEDVDDASLDWDALNPDDTGSGD